MLMSLPIYLFSLFGLALSFSQWTKSELNLGFMAATAFSAVYMLFAFLLQFPDLAAYLLINISCILGGYHLIRLNRRDALERYFKDNATTLIILCSLCLLNGVLSYGAHFQYIDDYSFWGTMSKYLFTFKRLPTDNTYIASSFLTYVPVMAAYHNLLYALSANYSVFLGYFAQNIIFTVALMSLINTQYPRRSSNLILATLLVFFLVEGSNALNYMYVDHLIAVWFFSLMWLVAVRGVGTAKILLFPLILLSTIKEIGLLFSLVVICVNYLIQDKNWKNLFNNGLLLFAVLATKIVWLMHTQSYHFHGLASPINLSTSLQALNPFDPTFHSAQWIYLKDALFNHFDKKIGIPYVLGYGFLIGGYYYLKKAYGEVPRERYILYMSYSLCIIFYLVSIYLLQAIVFNIGTAHQATLSFKRYFNMAFLPFFLTVLFEVVCKYFQGDELRAKKLSPVLMVILLGFCISCLIRQERSYWNPHRLTEVVEMISHSQAEKDKSTLKTVCTKNVPGYDYEIYMPLAYYFMPNKIRNNPTEQEMDKCDLLLTWKANQPLPEVKEMRTIA